MSPQRFESIPMEIEAIQWTGDNEAKIQAWVGIPSDLKAHVGITENWLGFRLTRPDSTTALLWVRAAEMWLPVTKGDWIAAAGDAGFYLITDEVFSQCWRPKR